MPLLCSCVDGHRWEQVSFLEAPRCPQCGAAAQVTAEVSEVLPWQREGLGQPESRQRHAPRPERRDDPMRGRSIPERAGASPGVLALVVSLAVLGILGGGGAALWQFLYAQDQHDMAQAALVERDAAEHRARQVEPQLRKAQADIDKARAAIQQVGAIQDAALRDRGARVRAEESLDRETRRAEQLNRELAKAQQEIPLAENRARLKGVQEAENRLGKLLADVQKALAKAELDIPAAEKRGRLEATKETESRLGKLLAEAQKAHARTELEKQEAEKQGRALGLALKRIEEETAPLKRDLYYRSLAVVELEGRLSRFEKSREVLDSCPEDLRHWEWAILHRQLPRTTLVPVAHSSQILSTLWSSDGKYVASCETQRLRVWQGDTGKEVFAQSAGPYRAIAFHPAMSQLAVAYWTHAKRKGPALALWDVEAKKELMTFPAETGPDHLAFSADGKRLAAATGKAVSIWNVAQKKVVLTLKDQRYPVSGIAYSVDGRWLATTGRGFSLREGEVRVYDAAGGGLLLDVKCEGIAQQLAFSPNSKYLATGGQKLMLWDLAALDAKAVRVLDHGGKTTFLSVAFSKDGTRLFAGCSSGELQAWNLVNGNLIFALQPHGPVHTLGVSPDGQRLVAGCGKEIHMLNTTAGSLTPSPSFDGETTREFGLNVLERKAGPVQCLAYDPEGRFLAVAAGDTIQLWDVAIKEDKKDAKDFPVLPQHKKSHLLAGHGFPPEFLQFNGTGTLLVSLARKGTAPEAEIKVWNTTTGKEAWSTVMAGLDNISFVQFTSDGKLIASSQDGIFLWDAPTGKRLPENDPAFPAQPGRRLLGLRPDGKGIVRIADVRSNAAELSAPGDMVTKLENSELKRGQPVWGPQGKYFAMTQIASVSVWNAATGKLILTAPGSRITRHQVSFSRDGRRLAFCDGLHSLVLFDPESQRQVLAVSGPAGIGRAVAFSPDGLYLASASVDGALFLWGPWIRNEPLAPPRKKSP